MRDDFAVFVLSHGRPDRVKTVETLTKQGYTGDWFIILDDEDKTKDDYMAAFGKDRIIVFSKKAAAAYVDAADISDDRRAVVYARNACFDIAGVLGLRYFLQLDDDYTCIHRRYMADGKLRSKRINDLDGLFSAMIDFLDDSGALTVALAQGGDFIGGKDNDFWRDKIKRKAMNTFFCDVRKRFDFVGRINEDVNTYTLLGNRGELILSVADANIVQLPTQKNPGGMTDLYLDKGTYLKSFYSVIFSPQAVKIAEMGNKNKRLHHKVACNYCAPKILSGSVKKGG